MSEKCPPCNNDCRQGRDCPEKKRVRFEDLYRAAMHIFAKRENKRMQKVSGSKGVWPSQMEASSRGALGGRNRKRVFFDPQDTHKKDGSLK